MRSTTVQMELAESGQDSDKETNAEMMYGIDDAPPWYISIILGFQHYLTMFGSTVAIPFILCPKMCIEPDDPSKGYIIATIFFVSGIITLFQSTLGVRLPIVQGGTFTFIAPTLAILSLEQWKCPDDFEKNGWGSISYEEKTEEWQKRMREIQGAIIVASVGQIILGGFGIIGVILKFVTPLTIAPAITMVGLALIKPATDFAAKDWKISLTTIIVMFLLSQYLRNINIPCSKYSQMQSFPIFKVFPVILTILSMWLICFILTITDTIPEGSPSRTDNNLNLVNSSIWFRIPYPLQWGTPMVHVGGVVGMLTGIVASAIESVGDYYACARLCEAPPPPTHAINRGIGMEGLGCLLAGLLGSGNGTTSYSENIGAIGVTKVGSRRVIQFGAVLMIFFGLFPKFGALFLTVPVPIVGGIFVIMFSMIAAVGLSNLQFVNLNSTRNLLVLGFSIFFSIMIPLWASEEENEALLKTGYESLDQIILVVLKTGMFLGGVIGFFLDNTIPGSDVERGITAWKKQTESKASTNASTYDLPYITAILKRYNWTKYVPIFPTYSF